MPTWPSIEAFQRDVAALGREMDRELAQATRRMAKRAEKIADQAARKDLGGDTRFSGWTPGPDLSHLRIRQVRPNGHIIYPSRQAAGGWTVAQFGRNRGNAAGFQGPGVNRRTGITSRTQAGNVRKVRTVQGKRWNGYTAGKGTADRALKQFDAEAEKIADVEFRRTLSRRFDVT